jgi:hypothetical protein
LSGPDEPVTELAQRIRSLAEELADLALHRLLDATERDVDDPTAAVAAERRLTRAARALEKAAGELEALSATADGDRVREA